MCVRLRVGAVNPLEVSHARIRHRRSGWIGSGRSARLISGGHEVVGLARSEASAEALAAAGAHVQRGTLDDLDTLRDAAGASDGVIHLAFKHDVAFSGGFLDAAQADRRAVEAIGEALVGTDRPLLVASGTLAVSPGQVATELDGHGSNPAVSGWGDGPRTRWETAEYTSHLRPAESVRQSVRLRPTMATVTTASSQP